MLSLLKTCSFPSEVEIEDPVKEKLALKVCREDLTKAQVELNRLHAEYGDVVPRRDWETLDHTHKENLLKVQFNEMFDSTTAVTLNQT